MPGSLGTGNPLTFRCAKCKQGNWRDSNRGTNWLATGARKESRAKRAGPRADRNYLYGYRCLTCQHHGWSRHESVRDSYKAIRAASTTTRQP